MNFKPTQLENALKNLNPNIKCIVLFGNNEGQIAALQKKCAEAVCGDVNDAFRYVALDAEQISKEGSEIYAEYYAQSLMGGRRAVVVKNAGKDTTPIIKNILPETTSENVLILSSADYNTKSALITWAKDRDDCVAVGCYEDREENMAVLAAELLQAKGLDADKPTLQFLCARLSPDRKISQGEIDKLAVYMDDRTTVLPEDVAAAISDSAGANIEDLCYFVAGGEVLKADKMFSRLINQGEDAASLVRQISYHFSRLLSCVAQAEQGKHFEDIIKNIHPPLMFYRREPLKKQMQVWNRDRILSALKLLYDTERDCKTTNMPAEQCAGYMILRLTGAAQKWLKQR